jgi:hypothetical protein
MTVTATRLASCFVLCAGGLAPLAAQQSSPSHRPADHAGISVAVRLSTLGLGVEVGKLLTSHASVRVGANYFKSSATKKQSDITYNADLHAQALSALIDLYPHGGGSFHFTAGIMTNPVKVTATGQPSATGTYEINGQPYTSAQIGVLTGEGKYPSAGPYVGLGFGTPSRKGGPMAFLFDLGVVIGQPTITLAATGAACGTGSGCAANLQAQQAKTQSDVRKYAKVYPVVSFGLAYRF